jgi:hypothetical protein
MSDDADDLSFHVAVRVAVPGQEEFRLAFDFAGKGADPNFVMRCSRDLSASEGARLQNLVTTFVGNVADAILRLH